MRAHSPDRDGGTRWSGWTTAFLVLLALGWVLIVSITVGAVRKLGLAAATTTFSGDLGHPWRAQYDTDFLLHIALIALWILYRTRSRIAGIVLALFAINGALFTLPYLFVATILARGNMRSMLLGWRYSPSADAER